MLGAISHTVSLLTALDYYAHGCTFALKSRPFLGTQGSSGAWPRRRAASATMCSLGHPEQAWCWKASHISWRSTSSTQRGCALELKCSAAAESLCGLVIRGKLWARFVPSLWMPAPLGAQQCHRAPYRVAVIAAWMAAAVASRRPSRVFRRWFKIVRLKARCDGLDTEGASSKCRLVVQGR
jgi:hypothetical protein